MYNKVFLIGNLAKDPELRYTPSGVPVVRMTLAVNRPKTKAAQADDDKSDADFIPVVAWRRLAEVCGEYLKKGRPVSFEGRLQVRSYEKGGEKKTMAEVVADGMQMLGKREGAAGDQYRPSRVTQPAPEAPHGDISSEEVPF